MTGSEEFLDLYKQLETTLELMYQKAKRKYSSVVFEYLKSRESEPIRGDLETCREIRNLLTHNANVGGVPVVEPSRPVIEMLQGVLQYVKKPPLALDYATRGEQILKAALRQRVMRLMEVMEKNGFSHVPVLEDGEFCGVFSIGTVFQVTLHSKKRIDKDTTLAELKELIPIKEHNENYIFLPKTATYIEARRNFEHIRAKNRRISVVFITETGKQEERLLGMVTPFDVLNIHHE